MPCNGVVARVVFNYMRLNIQQHYAFVHLLRHSAMAGTQASLFPLEDVRTDAINVTDYSIGSQRIGERERRRPLAPMTVSILPDASQLNAIMRDPEHTRNIATHLDAHVKSVTVSDLSAVPTSIRALLKLVVANVDQWYRDTYQLNMLARDDLQFERLSEDDTHASGNGRHIIVIKLNRPHMGTTAYFLLRIYPEPVVLPSARSSVHWDPAADVLDRTALVGMPTDAQRIGQRPIDQALANGYQVWTTCLANAASFEVDGTTTMKQEYYPNTRLLDFVVHAPWNAYMSITVPQSQIIGVTALATAYESLQLTNAGIRNRFSLVALDCLLHACSRFGNAYYDVSLSDFVVTTRSPDVAVPYFGSFWNMLHIRRRPPATHYAPVQHLAPLFGTVPMAKPIGMKVFYFTPRITCHQEALFTRPAVRLLDADVDRAHGVRFSRIEAVLRMVFDFLRNMYRDAVATFERDIMRDSACDITRDSARDIARDRARNRFRAMSALIDNWGSIQERVLKPEFDNVSGVDELGYVLYEVVEANEALQSLGTCQQTHALEAH